MSERASNNTLQPLLVGERVTIRPGRADDVASLCAILSEPSVVVWWGEPSTDPPLADEVSHKLLTPTAEVQLVLAVDGEVAGGIEYYEETEPEYRHANIDIFVSGRFQGRGIGTEAVALLARFLFDERGHHRLTIDPAVANTRAIRSYEKVGFKPVGVMRQYERGPDGTFHDGLLMDMLRGELP